jgi:hypothetical protein
MMRETACDEVLKAYLIKWGCGEDGHLLTEFMGYKLEPFDVKSMVYLDVPNTQALITRAIPFTTSGVGHWGYQLGETLNLSMERMFTLNEDQSDFLFEHPNEEQMIMELHAKFLQFIKKLEEHQNQEEETSNEETGQEPEDPDPRRGRLEITSAKPTSNRSAADIRSEFQQDSDLKYRKKLMAYPVCELLQFIGKMLKHNLFLDD